MQFLKLIAAASFAYTVACTLAPAHAEKRVPNVEENQEVRLARASLAEQDIVADLQARGVRVAVVVLDACTNPFTRPGARGVGGDKGSLPYGNGLDQKAKREPVVLVIRPHVTTDIVIPHWPPWWGSLRSTLPTRPAPYPS